MRYFDLIIILDPRTVFSFNTKAVLADISEVFNVSMNDILYSVSNTPTESISYIFSIPCVSELGFIEKYSKKLLNWIEKTHFGECDRNTSTLLAVLWTFETSRYSLNWCPSNKDIMFQSASEHDMAYLPNHIFWNTLHNYSWIKIGHSLLGDAGALYFYGPEEGRYNLT